ncbi:MULTISPECIES: hypothetical protein [Bacillus cereus group]|uniref:hypothetical protein n=1 Tax=Bacillus cereus group TaxID=86661 RepID=UPI0015EC7EFE|nr:hypothetical protein [Bacillus cereus]
MASDKEWQEAALLVRQVVMCYWTICYDHFPTCRIYVWYMIDIYRNGGETNDD